MGYREAVAARMSARIETHQPDTKRVRIQVAAHMGAWIETVAITPILAQHIRPAVFPTHHGIEKQG